MDQGNMANASGACARTSSDDTPFLAPPATGHRSDGNAPTSVAALCDSIENAALQWFSDASTWTAARSVRSKIRRRGEENTSTASSSQRSSETVPITSTSRLPRNMAVAATAYRTLCQREIHSSATRSLASVTERDVFYQLKGGVATSQHQVSMSVRDLCDAVQAQLDASGRFSALRDSPSSAVTRMDLGFCASAKSSLFGNIVLHLGGSSAAVHVAALGTGGLPLGMHLVASLKAINVPPSRAEVVSLPAVAAPKSSFLGRGECGSLVTLTAPFLLVVEKEATLHHLFSSDRLLLRYPQSVVLCCRGFPCEAAQTFVRLFRQWLPEIPVWSLTDGDVYGLHIYWCLLRTPLDKRWWAAATRNTTKQRGHSGGFGSVAPAVAANVREFLEAAAGVHHVGLLPLHVQALGLPLKETRDLLPQDRKRCEKLLEEARLVRHFTASVLMEGSDHAAEAAETVKFLLAPFDQLTAQLLLLLKEGRQAELQALLSVPRCCTEGLLESLISCR